MHELRDRVRGEAFQVRGRRGPVDAARADWLPGVSGREAIVVDAGAQGAAVDSLGLAGVPYGVPEIEISGLSERKAYLRVALVAGDEIVHSPEHGVNLPLSPELFDGEERVGEVGHVPYVAQQVPAPDAIVASGYYGDVADAACGVRGFIDASYSFAARSEVDEVSAAVVDVEGAAAVHYPRDWRRVLR